MDAICSLSTVTEDHGIHIIEIEAPEKFDGLSARIHDVGGQEVAAAVISRRETPGDRWRLTNAHELGHLVLGFAPDASDKFQEQAAFRFGAAFSGAAPFGWNASSAPGGNAWRWKNCFCSSRNWA